MIARISEAALVALGKRRIALEVGARQVVQQHIAHRAALKPLPMQPPLAARIHQSIRHQHHQHMMPIRARARFRQPGSTEFIQLQLLPQLHKPPTRAPLPGAMQPEFTQSHLHTTRRGMRWHTDILRKQRVPACLHIVSHRFNLLQFGSRCEIVDLSPRYKMCRSTVPRAI